MTTEEAITKYIVPAIEKTWNDKRCKEILKALEQEQCEDMISRQAVNEIINDIRDCISVEGYCAILERMKKLPSVNPVSNISIQITEREKYGRFN